MIITLTSDIGLQDYLVAAAKGRLWQSFPEAKIADVTHQLPPFNYPQAAYVCRNAIRNFPDFSYHIILVNLFERKPEQLLLAFHHNQYLLCADNGLINMILEEVPEMLIGLRVKKQEIKNTLYCIDVFAAAIRDINNGKRLQDIGEADSLFVEKNHLQPILTSDAMEGQIIFIDNFENVILNITRSQFERQRRNRAFRIEFRRNEHIERISETYADVAEGEKLALFNSAGYLEIAINKGNAAGLLFGLHGYREQANNTYLQNRLFYQTVKIFFE
jgi:S-adenosyl-L-methionine hydrolase (adenosine-forming)